MATSPLSSRSLDIRIIFEASLRQFALWLIMVLLVTRAGYPGVVCVTPMAWLLALRVGSICATRSRSTEPNKRLWEAVLSGGLLGFFEGLLFWIITPRMGPIQATERASAALIYLLAMGMGILAGSVLSFFTAYLMERRPSRSA